MRRKLKESDIIKIKNLLFNEEKKIGDLAKLYGYADISSFVKGLEALGYKIVKCLKRFEK
jgi:hypothetical protein